MAPARAMPAKTTLTYRHQRQDRYSVRTPPRISPIAPPPPAIAVKMPSALPRSRASVNVVVSRARADGASSAPKAPCTARAATSSREAWRGATRGRGKREPGQPGDEHALAAQQVRQPAAHHQQVAEGQRVGGNDPLPSVGGKAQRPLGRGQGDVHDRGVQHHHQLRHANHGQDQPAATSGGSVAAMPDGGVAAAPRMASGDGVASSGGVVSGGGVAGGSAAVMGSTP